MLLEDNRIYKKGWLKGLRKWSILLFLFLFLCAPLFMYLFWVLGEKTELKIAIIDKTVLTEECNEHVSFNWLLTYYKYSFPDKKLYTTNDYFGFFPLKDRKFNLKGLEIYSKPQLDSISNDKEMCYFTDTYGIYRNEWYINEVAGIEHSPLIYGGMSESDLYFLNRMKKQKKLILTEFNTIASPTSNEIRGHFENLFDLKWTGWVGRYFDDLDTTKNKEIPKWLIKNYLEQHNKTWPFKSSGIAFINNNDHVEILEKGTHLNTDLPKIYTNKRSRERFNLPPIQNYPYWFDIMKTKRSNNVVSVYSIDVNAKGDSIMKANGILKDFPAVIEHYDIDYKFYYFAGDFADNPISTYTSKFRGIRQVHSLFFSENTKGERTDFFWNYYTPLIQHILQHYKPIK
jgi:hypothetical protein